MTGIESPLAVERPQGRRLAASAPPKGEEKHLGRPGVCFSRALSNMLSDRVKKSEQAFFHIHHVAIAHGVVERGGDDLHLAVGALAVYTNAFFSAALGKAAAGGQALHQRHAAL